MMQREIVQLRRAAPLCWSVNLCKPGAQNYENHGGLLILGALEGSHSWTTYKRRNLRNFDSVVLPSMMCPRSTRP